MDTLVLVQSSSQATSAALRGMLSHAGVKGASLALPWDQVETAPGVWNLTTIEACRQLCVEEGKTFELRVRGGAHTPTWRRGRTWVPTGGAAVGLTLPCPFKTDGSPNDTFLDGYTALFSRLASYYGEHGISRPLHTTWYGGQSSEILTRSDSGITALPGYTYNNTLDAYTAIIDRGVALSASIELPLSGYGLPGFFGDLAAYMTSAMWTQTNGLRDGTWSLWPWGSTTPHGHQMVKAFPTDGRAVFDWTEVYRNALLSDSTHPPARFLEVYYASFQASNADQLYAEALKAASTTPDSPKVASFAGATEAEAVGPFLVTIGGVLDTDPAFEIETVGDFEVSGGADPVTPDCEPVDGWDITTTTPTQPASLSLPQLLDVNDDIDEGLVGAEVVLWDFDLGEWVARLLALDDLSDVDTTGFSDGDVLTVDVDGNWTPQTPTGGGSPVEVLEGGVSRDAAIESLNFVHGLDAVETTDHNIEINVDEAELDHGTLGGLGDDDHPQYATNAEFDDHSARHENGGADEISLAGLDGTPTELTNHLGDTTDAHDASAVSIADAGNYFSGTEVEAALQELGAAVGGTTIDIEDDSSPVASASTLDFGTGLTATDDGGGHVTIDATGGSTVTPEDIAYWGF